MSEHTISTKEARIITNNGLSKPDEIHLQTYNFSGQLPPPELFERYAAVDPASTKVIFDLVSRQQEILAERDKIEVDLYKNIVNIDSHYAMRGQWFAFFTILCFFILIGCAIFRDQQWVAGAALSLTALGYILKLFVSRPDKSDNRKTEQEKLAEFKRE
ncbi:MAG: hypothetical protein LBC02_13310 [Planctomycetaceae bacterium]|nr:hypothetical protein [Planctomycetaceae bacterium]